MLDLAVLLKATKETIKTVPDIAKCLSKFHRANRIGQANREWIISLIDLVSFGISPTKDLLWHIKTGIAEHNQVFIDEMLPVQSAMRQSYSIMLNGNSIILSKLEYPVPKSSK